MILGLYRLLTTLGGPAIRLYLASRNRDGDVAAVPIPTAAWLFGSALGLLGWMQLKTI